MEEAAKDFGVELWEHVGNVITAMRRIAPELGLVGNTARCSQGPGPGVATEHVEREDGMIISGVPANHADNTLPKTKDLARRRCWPSSGSWCWPQRHGITEEWKWGTPVWAQNGLVCAAGLFADHVKLNFFTWRRCCPI